MITHTEEAYVKEVFIQVSKFSKDHGQQLKAIFTTNRFQTLIKEVGEGSTLNHDGVPQEGVSLDQEVAKPPEPNG